MLLSVGMIKHSQSTQSNKFAISLQYLKKEVSHKVFNKNMIKQNFTCEIKYFSVTTAFLFCFDAKHLGILRESSHLRFCLVAVVFLYFKSYWFSVAISEKQRTALKSE